MHVKKGKSLKKMKTPKLKISLPVTTTIVMPGFPWDCIVIQDILSIVKTWITVHKSLWGYLKRCEMSKRIQLYSKVKGGEKNKKAVMIQTRIFQEACFSMASVIFSNLCDGIFPPGLAGVRFWTWTWLGHGKTHFRWRRVRRLRRTCSSRYSGLTRQAS